MYSKVSSFQQKKFQLRVPATAEQKNFFCDVMFVLKIYSYFGGTEGEGVEGEVSITSWDHLLGPY
jgi:hypothetical protein